MTIVMTHSYLKLWYNSLGVDLIAVLPDGSEVQIGEGHGPEAQTWDDFVTEHTDVELDEVSTGTIEGDDTYWFARFAAEVSYCRKVGITHIRDEEWDDVDGLECAELEHDEDSFLADWEPGRRLIPIDGYVERVCASWRRHYPDLDVKTGRLS